MAPPVRTKSGKSLGGKFAYRAGPMGRAIKTHKRFDRMEALQEKRVSKLEERNREVAVEVAKTLKAMQGGTATRAQVKRAVENMQASLRLVNRAIDHEQAYFGPVTFDMPDANVRRSMDRLSRLYSITVFKRRGKRTPVDQLKVIRERRRVIYGGGKKVVPLTPEEIAALKKPKPITRPSGRAGKNPQA